jgi:hypothetical protein
VFPEEGGEDGEVIAALRGVRGFSQAGDEGMGLHVVALGARDEVVGGAEPADEAGEEALALGAEVGHKAVLPYVHRLLFELVERDVLGAGEDVVDTLGQGEAALVVP